MSNEYTPRKEDEAFALPPVPSHPFRKSFGDDWSEMEYAAVEKYGHACAEAARAPLLGRIAELEQQRAALVEALLVLKREVHGGPLQAWRKADAALRAAGVATEGGLEE